MMIIGRNDMSKRMCIHTVSAKTSRYSEMRKIGLSLGPKYPVRVSKHSTESKDVRS